MKETDPMDQAVQIHDEQARLFRDRYEHLQRDPYWNTFTYTRKKIDEVCAAALSKEGFGAELLDVGCGTGHQLKTYGKQGMDCTGLDPSQKMLAEAVTVQSGARFVRGRADHMPFASDSFDVLLCVEVMRYMPRPAAVLQEALRVLRPGGLCLVSYAPRYATSGYALVNKVTSRRQIGDFARVRQYFQTAGELERLYAELAFTAVEVHARFIGPLVYLNRVDRELTSRVLRRWEPLDDRLVRRKALRNLTNLFVVTARKP